VNQGSHRLEGGLVIASHPLDADMAINATHQWERLLMVLTNVFRVNGLLFSTPFGETICH
jgi:hypothetical protein